MTTFWVALLTTLLLTGVLVPTLRRVGLHDVPNARSSHVTATPRGGGLAVLAGVGIGVAVGSPGSAATWWILGAVAVLGAVGLVDDASSLPSTLRLAAQVVVAGALGVGLAVTGEPVRAGLLVAVVGAVGVTAYVNAFNFMDGVNGISALNAVVAGGWFAWLGVARDLPDVALLGAVLAGAALGFLPWNAGGTVFLGDVGSYGIGTLVAATAAWAWASGTPVLLVLAPVAIYLSDTGWALVGRARRGQRLTEAHRDHVYQRIVRAGWPHLASAAWTAGLAVAICVAVATIRGHSAGLAAAAATLVLVAYLATPRALLTGSARQAGGR